LVVSEKKDQKQRNEELQFDKSFITISLFQYLQTPIRVSTTPAPAVVAVVVVAVVVVAVLNNQYLNGIS
jgi:hypothetical protein